MDKAVKLGESWKNADKVKTVGLKKVSSNESTKRGRTLAVLDTVCNSFNNVIILLYDLFVILHFSWEGFRETLWASLFFFQDFQTRRSIHLLLMLLEQMQKCL